MAFTVEDGTGLPTANSMATVAEFDSYHTDRGNADIVALPQNEKEALLIRGADYLKLHYTWANDKLVSTQSLPFPRTVFTLPSDIKTANIILAQKAKEYDLIADAERRVKKEKVSTLEVVYDEKDTTTGKKFTEVDLLVKPYLKSGNTEIFHKVERT